MVVAVADVGLAVASVVAVAFEASWRTVVAAVVVVASAAVSPSLREVVVVVVAAVGTVVAVVVVSATMRPSGLEQRGAVESEVG